MFKETVTIENRVNLLKKELEYSHCISVEFVVSAGITSIDARQAIK